MYPTPEAYAELQTAFEHFNTALFDGALPHCLITLQRERRTYGYFSRHRFVHHDTGELTDEIAMNPGYFAIRSIRETLSTLVHEMVHGWQFHEGKPGRRGYHNREWAQKMESVGLMPSQTGEPGGRKVGEQMTHYVIEGGPFDAACAALLTRDYRLSWLDRFPPECPRVSAVDAGDDDDGQDHGEPPPRSEGGELVIPAGVQLPAAGVRVNRSNRVKYRCPTCHAQAWGKPGLALLCGGAECAAAPFEPVE